jgi:hypothetical protein
MGILSREIDLENDLMPLRIGIEMIDDLDFVLFRPIHCGEIGQDLELQVSVVPQIMAYIDDRLGIHPEVGIRDIFTETTDLTRKLLLKPTVYFFCLHASGP